METQADIRPRAVQRITSPLTTALHLQLISSLSTILGHVKVIGSTVALGSSIVSGAWYILYQPYQQARAGSGWTGAAHGVVVGTKRFVAEVGSGFCFVIGQFAEFVATGVRFTAAIEQPPARSLLLKPISLTHGVVSGTMVLSSDCRAAAKAVVKLPRQGWADGGAAGCIAGAARGVSGLVLPLAGVFDLAAFTVFGVGAEIGMLGAQCRQRGAARGPRRNHIQVCFALKPRARGVPAPTGGLMRATLEWRAPTNLMPPCYG